MFELLGGHQFWSPGPLRTAIELKIALPTAKKQLDATALTETATNWLKRSKNIKILFRFFLLQNLPKLKNGKYGGFNGKKTLTL